MLAVVREMRKGDIRKSSFGLLVFVVSFLVALFSLDSASSSERISVGEASPNFLLRDAYDHTYELAEMKGNVVILAMGSRDLREQNRRWAKGLKGAFRGNDRLKIFMVADMRGIPFFITRDFIKGRIKSEDNPVPLLLDWEQKVNKLYAAQADRINIFVIDTEGVLSYYYQTSSYSDEGFRKLKEKVEEVLRGK